MKINLMEFVENNKKIENLRKEAKNKSEINKIIAAIITEDEYYYTDNKELLEEIGTKYTKENNSSCFTYTINGIIRNEYKVKLTKENIKKINKYINKEV